VKDCPDCRKMELALQTIQGMAELHIRLAELAEDDDEAPCHIQPDWILRWCDAALKAVAT